MERKVEQLFHQLISPSTRRNVGASHEREKKKKKRADANKFPLQQMKARCTSLIWSLRLDSVVIR